VTVRLGLIVAPLDPLLDSEAARREALAWLRGQLARRGFQVAIVGAGDNPSTHLEQTLAGMSSADVVLVHVSGRLEGSDSVAMGRASALRLADLGGLLAACAAGYVSVILDLQRDVDRAEERNDTEIATAAARPLAGAERGQSVLAALRPAVQGADRISFTRKAIPPFDARDGPPSGEELLSVMHDRASASDPSGERAGGIVFLRGAPDPTIDGLIARATAARDWPRVVELRLDRAQTLATAGPRIHELSSVARMLLAELQDAEGAIEVLEQARSLDLRRAGVLELLKHAYEAAGRAPPIDPAEFLAAFTAHSVAGQTDAALLDAMALVEMGAAEPVHEALVDEQRSVGPVQILKPLDTGAWSALRAPGFDQSLAALLASIHEAAIGVRIEQMQSSRKIPSLDPAQRLDSESTVSAVRTFHWAARVLGVTCPDLFAAPEGAEGLVTQVAAKRPSILLAPSALSGTPTKQLAFLAGSSLAWHLPEYQCLLYYRSLDDLEELVRATLAIAATGEPSSGASKAPKHSLERRLARHLGDDGGTAMGEAASKLGARGGEIGLNHWIRSAELTAARTGLLLCGELKTALLAVRSQPRPEGRPTAERITGDLIAFCASQAHRELRARFVAPSQSVPPPPRE
jgi:hypothetical protein